LVESRLAGQTGRSRGAPNSVEILIDNSCRRSEKPLPRTNLASLLTTYNEDYRRHAKRQYQSADEAVVGDRGLIVFA
jgi:hypothetical protein